MTTTLPTTELDAVNIMLDCIGQDPVDTLEGGGLPDAARARRTLREISLVVQGEGWHWNTEADVRFIPDALGSVRFGSDVLRADLSTTKPCWLQVSKRGTALFNREDNSYTFPADFEAFFNLTRYLEWELLPQAAKYYITLRAARTFAARNPGSDTIVLFTQADEDRARAEVEREALNQANLSYLDAADIRMALYRGAVY